MKKIWHPILVSVSCLWGLFFGVNLWGSMEEEPSPSRIVEAKTFEELKAFFTTLKDTDAFGWDCDNTWIVLNYERAPGFIDFESSRELKHLWKEAGDAAVSEGLFRGDVEDFGGHCHDVIKRKTFKDEYALLEARMLEVHQSARALGCDSFVCTGLAPGDDKVNFLIRSGFDLSNDYKNTDNVNTLFASYGFSTFGGWLYAPDNKAHSMMSYIEKRNLDRQAVPKPPLTRLFYVDNDLGTLKRIDASFKMIGVELVPIHWRMHALGLEEKHRLGQLVPQILEGYRTLTKPIEPRMGFGPSLRCSQENNSVSSGLLASSGFVGLSLCAADYDSEDDSTPLPLAMVQNGSPTPGEGFDTGSAYNSGEEEYQKSPVIGPLSVIQTVKSPNLGNALDSSGSSK